jgi:glycosyltransferase involved in cell wall biosynthesis|tara:strand:+ start:328 stop:1656 length:1329 start_codon:yes stop_codon:yes gene_type:complete
MKPMILVTAPVKTRSGYGNHSRDICTALIESDKYDVKINSVRWGNTPMTALEENNSQHDKIKSHLMTGPDLQKQPDVHLHIVIPGEFNPIGRKNVGMTAGIESTIPIPQWVEGVNRMDETIFTSEFSKAVFEQAAFNIEDKQNPNKKQELKVNKPMSVLFEGVDTDVYKETKTFGETTKRAFKPIKEDFCYLFTGHWLGGSIGKDRKDVGMLIKVFLETFKNTRNQPALLLKTSGADFSILDREDILNKITYIKEGVVGSKLPSIYLIHGDFTDSEMNELYNHPKVKAHVTFTHGEGFGRPLLEAAQSGKPIVAPGWSGHVDFLHKNYAQLLPGSLTKVPMDAFPKDMAFDSPENKWITVNYNVASSIFTEIHNNYSKYVVKGKQLQAYTKLQFSYEAMKSKLEAILDPIIASIPQQVELKLPKLSKVEDNKGLKLPKLKKV